MNSNIVPGAFVAISDFHSYSYPVDKIVDYYLDEYETIYILGDATDRGPKHQGQGGIEILSRIKDLSEKTNGRVVYIPGNHDLFLYDYGKYNDSWSLKNMRRNGGGKTAEEFKKLKKDNSQKAEELIEWLGDLPLQIRHEYDNRKFALAHAFFNQRIYEKFPNLSLKNLFAQKSDREVYSYLANIIWFRKAQDLYYKNDVPSNDTTVVIGHTPEGLRQGEILDLENAEGKMVKVHCVDGGITYNGDMLKYDGGFQTYKTMQFSHNDTSPKNSHNNTVSKKTHKLNFFSRKQSGAETVDFREFLKAEDLFQGVILDVVRITRTLDEAKKMIMNFYTTKDVRYLPENEGLRERASLLTTDEMQGIVFDNGILNGGSGEEKITLESLCSDYIDETIVDHVFLSLEERFRSRSKAIDQLTEAIQLNEYGYITQKVGSARSFAIVIGTDGMKRVMAKRGCKNVRDYVTSKLGKERTY